MTQYEEQNAAHCVDGYYIARPGESAELAFARAKKEALENLKTFSEHVQSLTMDQFGAFIQS